MENKRKCESWWKKEEGRRKKEEVISNPCFAINLSLQLFSRTYATVTISRVRQTLKPS
jgi:hypothetical protein